MTTPTGTISLQDVQDEFGGAVPISINEYYRGALVSENNTGVPDSGTISMSQLRGATAGVSEINYTLDQSFSSGNGTYSASIQSGDLLVMTMSRGANYGETLTSQTYRPAGFTETAFSSYSGGSYIEWAGYAVASSGTAGSTFIAPPENYWVNLHVYRPDAPLISVTARDVNTQSTTGNPSAQVKNGSSYSNPHVTLAFLGHNQSATNSFSWSGSTYDRYTAGGIGYANNRTITQGFNYGEGVDVTVDASDLGWGMLHSCILELA